MHFLGIGFLFCHLCPVVADPIKVQTQQWGVVGSQQAEEQVLLNGVSFTSQPSADTLLPALISESKTPALNPDILQFLIPVLAILIFGLLGIVSILVYKRKGGLRHPGGILGSVVHYHRDFTGTDSGIV